MKKKQLFVVLALVALAFTFAACSKDPQALAKRFYELDQKRNSGSSTAQELEDWGEIRRQRARWAEEFIAKVNSEKGVDMASDPSVIFEDTLEKLQAGGLTLDSSAGSSGNKGGSGALTEGKWVYESGVKYGRPEAIELLKDGTGIVDGQLSVRWRVEGKSLILSNDYTFQMACDYKLSGAKLTLTYKDDGSTATFVKRAQAGTEPQKAAAEAQARAKKEAEPERTANTAKESGTVTYYIYHGKDLLRVRSEPDTSVNNVIAKLAEGDKVALLETGKMDNRDGINAPWFKVKTADGKTGWVFSGYLTAETANSAGAKNTGTTAQASANAALESHFSVGLTASSDGVVITGYTGPGGAVVIPAVIQGYPVRGIGSAAFQFCTSRLISVTIPDSVTTIGSSAFAGCDSLTSVTIPGSVKTIESNAFMSCTSLASITIPGSVITIGSSAFFGCDSLASITIPDNVKTIETNAFFSCANLATVTISPVTGRKWAYGVFTHCPKLSLASQSALRAAGYTDGF
jgi:hypothetical protein